MQHYVVESNDGLLSKLPVPFRVNCVLYKNYPAEQLVPYMERFRKLPGASIQFRFDYKGMELTYHKTLPYSTIVETDPVSGVTYDILYDILIKQNGDIHSDWDGTPLDVDAYEKVVFEPYDLRWLARIA